MATTSILTNGAADAAAGAIRHSVGALKNTSDKLATGKRISEAREDAAGLSIGTGLMTDQSTLTAALSTASQGLSVLNIADGGLKNISDILARMKSLASQANSAALGTTELGYIQQEIQALITQNDSIVTNTTFNGTALIDGTYSSKAYQIGIRATDTISITLAAADTTTLGISSINVTSSVSGANTALDTAIDTVKGMRATVGAYQSSFTFAAANIETGINNLSAAKSVYLDADFADVSIAFANQQTQLQAAIATLAQANSLPANLLKLIS